MCERRWRVVDKALRILRQLLAYTARLNRRWLAVCTIVALIVVGVYVLANRGRKVRAHKVVALGLLSAYSMATLVLTVFARPKAASRHQVNLDVVGTVTKRLGGGDPTEILVNLIMFIPVGFLLPIATGWNLAKTMAASLGFTCFIELSQLVSARGSFELSDIVENMLSAFVGYAVYAAIARVRTNKE